MNSNLLLAAESCCVLSVLKMSFTRIRSVEKTSCTYYSPRVLLLDTSLLASYQVIS